MIKRLLQFIEYQNISISAFEKEINASEGVLRKAIKNNSDIQSKWLINISEYYPNLNTEWLLTGKGEMLKSEKVTTNHLPTFRKMIPLIPLDAMAGFGTGDVSVMDYETEQYYVPEFERLQVDYMIRVKGSSMQPKYNSGDVVACKKIPLDGLFFQWNKVYVLDTVQGALIKRIHQGEDKEHIKIVSDNKDYPPFELNVKENVRAVALVVGVVRLE